MNFAWDVEEVFAKEMILQRPRRRKFTVNQGEFGHPMILKHNESMCVCACVCSYTCEAEVEVVERWRNVRFRRYNWSQR